MSEHPFKNFIDLITFDQKIITIESQIAQLHRDIADAHAEIAIALQKHDIAKNNAHDARKIVDEFELEIKELDEQEKSKKRQIDALSNYKEYQSIKNEIDALKAKQHTLETTVLEAWNALESAQKEYETAKQTYETKHAELQAVVDEKLKTIKELERSAQELFNQRPAREKLVPAEWLEKYAMMRSRVSDPVVPVQKGSCTACFYTVSDQEMLSLRRRALLQCKGCYRLLYSPEAMLDAS